MVSTFFADNPEGLFKLFHEVITDVLEVSGQKNNHRL